MKSIKIKLISLFLTLVVLVMIVSGAFIRISLGINEEARAREELEGLVNFYVHLSEEASAPPEDFRADLFVIRLTPEGYTEDGIAVNSPVVIGAMAGNSTFLPWQETQILGGRLSIWMQYATPITINDESFILYLNLDATTRVENLNLISQTIFIGILIATLMAIFLGYLYSKTFTKPIIELTRAAKKMGDGKFEEEAKIYGDDEIGELTASFNNMSKNLGKLDTMRKEFVANVSHEIRTPLTVIKTYAETLKYELEESEIAQKFLTTIDTEVDRITLLATDLLELSHFDTDQMTFSFEYKDLGQILKSSIKQVKVLSEKKSQEIISEIEENMVCYVDSVRINQVFVNILSNAVKYSKEGRQIRVKAEVKSENYKVTIEDEGIGIPEKDLEHIFERFYRVDKARSRESGGSGLGLSIVKEVLDKHEASIKAKSSSLGTVFELFFKKENLD